MKMLRKIVFCFLCILFAGTYSILHAQNSYSILHAQNCVGKNIVQNPGFINDFDGWQKSSKNSTWVIDSEGKNTPKSAYISSSNSGFRANLMQFYGNVTPGTYSLKANFKMSGKVRYALIELYVDNEWKRTPIPAGSEWNEMTISDFNVPSHENFALRISISASAGAMFGVDDFSIELKSIAPSEDLENPDQPANLFGRFDIDKDLLLIHHDNYRDVDDIHAIGAHGSMLRDARFADVNYYAVGGTYGKVSGGLWYDVSDLMNLAFGNKWTECHLDWDGSVDLIAAKVENTLKNCGNVWIAEGWQSDFSADGGRKVIQNYPEADLKQIHLVQHHYANENMTTPADLDYVKENFSYHFIDKGNNFEADGIALASWMDSDNNNAALWEKVKKDPKIMDLWKEVETQCEYWLSQEGTLSEGILGRFGFSDTIETTWIFGFNEAGNGTIKLYDCKSFFNEFGTLQYCNE